MLQACRAQPVATTSYGTVAGDVDHDFAAVRRFRGVPYAAPPVGPLRWAPPAPPAPWSPQPLAATAFGAACLQDVSPTFTVQGRGATKGNVSISEDCLYLNVWTACADASCGLPVMVYVHGGGFVTGSAALYDGAPLASRGVVVVTLNYRLGVFGFIASPLLPAGAVNLGIQDQQAVLHWVAANIGAFGGDPARVTLFGQSAGSHSVSTHLLAPASQGLFCRAILQSGAIAWYPALPPSTGLAAQTLPMAQRSAAAFFSFLGCATLACVRAAPADAVLRVQLAMEATGAFFQLVLDGAVVPTNPTAAFAEHGALTHVDVLAGFNAQEGTLFLDGLASSNPLVWYHGPWSQSHAGLDFTAATIFSAAGSAGRLHATAATAQYAPSQPHYNGSTVEATQALMRDYFFACPIGNMLAGVAAKRGAATTSVYAYVFSHVPSWFSCDVATTSEFCTLGTHMGAMHSAEIPFLFGKRGSVPFNAQELALADAMQAAWVSFAATGEPRPGWPAWDASMSLGLEWNTGAGFPAPKRLFADCAPLFAPPAGNAAMPAVPAVAASVVVSSGGAVLQRQLLTTRAVLCTLLALTLLL